MDNLPEYVEIIDGELLDDNCQTEDCPNQGRWMRDPYDADVNNRIVMVCLCDRCEQNAYDDI